MKHNIVSVSGGKDSTALLLLALEQGAENSQAVFADTGHEHEITLDYVRYLERATGVPIRWVRADFSEQIAAKREYVRAHWVVDLMKGTPGEWEWEPANDDCAPGGLPTNPLTGQGIREPASPMDPFVPAVIATGFGRWVWLTGIRPLPALQAEEQVAIAIEALQPTGNPFLDLCLWKGRFPSARARFCSEELKRNPIMEQVQIPLMAKGRQVVSWQGVRADESLSRSKLLEREIVGTQANGGGLSIYRPLLSWTAAQCFEMHRRHGIKHNPLYAQGMGRVGCMPCIHARKDELLEISRRFPGHIERMAMWESAVGKASKRRASTFFAGATVARDQIKKGGLVGEEIVAVAGIWSAVEWSKTSRGGRQFDMLRASNDTPLCSSIYGLCE